MGFMEFETSWESLCKGSSKLPSKDAHVSLLEVARQFPAAQKVIGNCCPAVGSVLNVQRNHLSTQHNLRRIP